MATAFTRAMLARIKGKGGWTWVFEQIGEGTTMSSIADQISVSRSFLSHYIRRNKTLTTLKLAAYKNAAEYHVEKGLEVLEDVKVNNPITSKDEMSKAKALAEYHRWLAQKYDAEFFGDKKANENHVQVNLLGDIGALHVHATKEARKVIAARKQKVEAHVLTSGGPQPVEAEIITEGEASNE